MTPTPKGIPSKSENVHKAKASSGYNKTITGTLPICLAGKFIWMLYTEI